MEFPRAGQHAVALYDNIAMSNVPPCYPDPRTELDLTKVSRPLVFQHCLAVLLCSSSLLKWRWQTAGDEAGPHRAAGERVGHCAEAPAQEGVLRAWELHLDRWFAHPIIIIAAVRDGPWCTQPPFMLPAFDRVFLWGPGHTPCYHGCID
eukprot:1547042-Rhodomonas_salina.1